MAEPRIDPDCVFCKIADGTAPAADRIAYGNSVSFSPLNPVTVGHRLVIPRRHVADFTAPASAAEAMEIGNVAVTASWIAKRLEAEDDTIDGFNLITSAGAAATQTVFHLHLHVVPRRHGDGLLLPWSPIDESPAVRAWANTEYARGVERGLSGD